MRPLTAGLKQFFTNSVPTTCNGTSPEAIRKWYILFTQMATTTGFYLHPYYCFRKNADSNYGFTCGFDTGPVTTVTAAPEVLHRPYLPAVVAVVGVAATGTTAAVTAVTGVPKVPKIVHVPERFAVAASSPVQYDLPGLFQPRIPPWSSQIYVALSKGSVFKKGTLQHTTLLQNAGDGYAALYQILSPNHPTLSNFSSLLVRTPPSQTTTETVAQYYLRYIDFLELCAFLEEIRSTLNSSSELAKFIHGMCHSQEIFHISCEERLSQDPSIQRKFTQGALVTSLTHYLSELKLSNGKPYSSHSRYDDSDSDSDSDSAPSQFSNLQDSARTKFLSRSAPTSSKKKKKKKKPPPTRRVMRVDVSDPIASLVVPHGLKKHEILRVKMYTAGLRQVTKNPTKSADGMNCAVCHEPHSFEKCPILLNIPFLKKHFIAYCLQMNRTQK